MGKIRELLCTQHFESCACSLTGPPRQKEVWKMSHVEVMMVGSKKMSAKRSELFY